jgi:hypothetical protein
LSPSPRPSAPPAAKGDDVLGRRAELDADEVVVHVDAEGARRDRELELHGERQALAGDHRGGRQPARDLVRDVRAGEDRDRPVGDERREPLARDRIEALREAQDGALAGSARRPRRTRRSAPRRRRGSPPRRARPGSSSRDAREVDAVR